MDLNYKRYYTTLSRIRINIEGAQYEQEKWR
jgi:hypothetical protein